MAIHDLKENITVCCERMLMELGHTIHLNSIQWPHLGTSSISPSIDRCPWCGAKMPFDSEGR